MIKFSGIFALFGVFVPIICFILGNIFIKFTTFYAEIFSKWEMFQLAIWPSSIFMLATAGSKGTDYKMLIFSIGANAIIYGVLGFLLWWGLNRQRLVLIITAAAILFGWYKIFTS